MRIVKTFRSETISIKNPHLVSKLQPVIPQVLIQESEPVIPQVLIQELEPVIPIKETEQVLIQELEPVTPVPQVLIQESEPVIPISEVKSELVITKAKDSFINNRLLVYRLLYMKRFIRTRHTFIY